MPDTLHIGFPIFTGVTQLDFTGPWEVLTRTPGARCHLVAHTLEPVVSASGLAVVPTTRLADCPPLGVVCVPGGPGHLGAMEDEALLAFLREQAQSARYVTAVCTGALVLAAAGLLAGYRATTHWMSRDRLARFGAIPKEVGVVVVRNRFTGGGVTAGIDFGLSLLAALAGETTARAVQLQLEYAPSPPFSDGSPDTAAPDILARVRTGGEGYAQRMAEVDARASQRLARA
jgi:cyclohexyl-isocyanide hydratase